MNMKQEVSSGTIQSIPAGALVGFTIFGLSVNEVAAVIGAGFIVLQAAFLLWKWRREWRKAQAEDAAAEAQKP